MRRSVLTIATGKPIYWSMAMELARSFRYWHKGTDIKFSVITDMVDARAIIGVDKILISPGEFGIGFSTKLHLDRFVTSGQTLFIDADCLCVRPLDSVFTRFKGKSVSVVGGTIADGEWFGDVRRTCELAGVPCLPKFNGGIYYLES
jgi:hypothetical protein